MLQKKGSRMRRESKLEDYTGRGGFTLFLSITYFAKLSAFHSDLAILLYHACAIKVPLT